jgi:peptidyl-prolyl cis-trans isomerase D
MFAPMKLKCPLILLICFTVTVANAQTISERIKILEDFMQTSNDSEFVTKHSAMPFERFTASRYVLTYKFQPTDSLVFFHHVKGDLIGPYTLDTLTAYVKVMRVDSTVRMRAGSIYLNPEKKGKSAVNTISKEILSSLKKGTAGFEEMCLKYGDDSTAQTTSCDLGWFFQNAMVPEFEKAVLKHKKGDYFVVDTKAGKYVVNLKEEPVKDRAAVIYTILYLKNTD